MDTRILALVTCFAALAATCGAQEAPVAVIYINSFNIGDLDTLLATSFDYPKTFGYTHFLFAFWTARFGPVDAALVWQMNKLGSDPRILAARQRGVKFIISTGGATEEPQRTMTGTAYANGAAKFAVENGFDGVDFDIEGFVPGNDGVGTQWVVDATFETKRIFPTAIVTHAPQAPYFTTQFSVNFLEVERQAGTMIDFYNIQFYNQGSTKYEDYRTLFLEAEGWSRGTAVQEISAGIPLSKIVIGKPVTRAGVVNSGFVPMASLAQMFQRAKTDGILPRGFMGWQWSLDVNELQGQWAPTLGAAWVGGAGTDALAPPLPGTGDPLVPPFGTGGSTTTPTGTVEPVVTPVGTGSPSGTPAGTGDPFVPPTGTGSPSETPAGTGDPYIPLDPVVPVNGGSCSTGTLGNVNYIKLGAQTACGGLYTDSDMVAGVSKDLFGQDPNPNTSGMCDKCMRVCGPQGTLDVKVEELCYSCSAQDIVLSEGAFTAVVGSLNTWPIPQVQWQLVQCA